MAALPEVPHRLLYTILAYAFPAALVAGAICLLKLEAGGWIISKVRSLFRGKQGMLKAKPEEKNLREDHASHRATERG